MISDKTLAVLEFPRVVEHLADQTSFSLARARALDLLPATTPEAAQALLNQTREAVQLIEQRAAISLGGAHDIRPSVTRASLGGVLDPTQLLAVQTTLECSDRIIQVLNRLPADEFPWMHDQRTLMGTFRGISQAIAHAIDDSGEVRDGASPALSRIRSDLRQAHNRVVDRLTQLMQGPLRTAVQEPLITLRGGRYVIPIKTDMKGQVKGLVHDQSSSGATVFIEPFQVTDLTNRWRQLQADEVEEVQRILRDLSAEIGAAAAGILRTVSALAALDLAMAKARYAASLKAVAPVLSAEPALLLIEARHPLLTGRVVPTTIALGDSFSVLVITGPNTGGKTVALKTVGLLTAMAQAGLYIPAAEGSRVAVFGGIYADIGDEQSIAQSLSTFSGHMTAIVHILRVATADSLILLDELGAGTDPTEGAALARAILTHLRARSARVIATTHYSELKAFAYTEPGVENASVEFDVETLSPTYRLSIGLPGRSNALAIATRLGLSEDVLADARGYLTSSDQHVETLLADIQRERAGVADLYAAANQASLDAHRLRDRLHTEVQAVLTERETLLANARAEAEASVAALHQELDRLEIQMRTALAQPQTGLTTQFKEQIDAAAAQVAPQLAAPRKPARPTPVAPLAPRDLGVGDRVEVMRLGQVGTVSVIHERSGEVEVQIGVLKTRVKRAELRPLSDDAPADPTGKRAAPRAPSITITRTRTPDVSMEIDVRGYRADEVSPQIDRYIQDAYMDHLPYVRIIHGKGTGALRAIVRQDLATNPLVARFTPGDARDGGDGVTIAHLDAG